MKNWFSSLSFRYKKHLDRACKSSFEPGKMPPTECAAYFHGLRVHLQIMTWKILDNDNSEWNPEKWGWYSKDNVLLLPIMTDMDVEPENLLKVKFLQLPKTRIKMCVNMCRVSKL